MDSYALDEPVTGGYENMSPFRMAITAAVVLLIVYILYVLYRYYSSLEGRLARAGWAVAYRRGCHYCEQQKKLIPGFANVLLYDADGVLVHSALHNAPETVPRQWRGVPHWFNTETGATRTGFQSKKDLEHMARRH